MKYKDPITGDYKELHFKTGDTLPVGTIVEYDGDEIPPGYKEVPGVVASVIISPTKPETGEEVWIQKGKNLFKKTNVINGIGPTSEGGFSVQSQCTTSYVKVIPGETYVISSNVDRSWVYNISKNIPKVGEEATSWMVASGKSVRVNIPSGYSYLNIRSHSESNNEDNLGQDIQVEQNTSVTEYEPYIDKKIYIKNDNGVYEEFYDEEEHNKQVYSTEEQRIGTWIDGKPLYRKVFGGLQCPNNAVASFSGILPNTDKIIRIEGISKTSMGSDEIYPIVFGKGEVDGIGLNLNQYSGSLFIVTTKDYSAYTCDVIVEYTKTTD